MFSRSIPILNKLQAVEARTHYALVMVAFVLALAVGSLLAARMAPESQSPDFVSLVSP